jgi:hypothetical protein
MQLIVMFQLITYPNIDKEQGFQNEKEIFSFIPGRKFDEIQARAIQNSVFVVSAKTPSFSHFVQLGLVLMVLS